MPSKDWLELLKELELERVGDRELNFAYLTKKTPLPTKKLALFQIKKAPRRSESF